MPPTSSLLPDVNVWLAMHHPRHQHHRASQAWFYALPPQAVLLFCRQTQLGLFRLLTTSAVMGGSPLPQHRCWTIYAAWLHGGRARLEPEPAALEAAFQARSSGGQPAPKLWMDAYLAAFAESARLTLVTFDRSLAASSPGALLLI